MLFMLCLDSLSHMLFLLLCFYCEFFANIITKMGSASRSKLSKKRKYVPVKSKVQKPLKVPSASEVKLGNINDVKAGNDHLGGQSFIVELECLNNLFSSLSCPLCEAGKLFVRIDSSVKMGCCVYLNLICSSCESAVGSCETSKKNGQYFQVNRRLVYAMKQIGGGHREAEQFMSVMNMPPPPNQVPYNEHTKALLGVVQPLAKETMRLAAHRVRGLRDTECGVSVDGSWHRRGYSSLNGVVTTLSIDTGEVLDVEVMSKHCTGCKKWSGRDKSSTEYANWEASHQCSGGHSAIMLQEAFKGGIILPLDHRHRVPAPGSLSIAGVQKAADEGEYTCTVRSPDGQTASGSTRVSVVVAPVIDSQFFPDTVTANEGERAKMICSATTGDPPIRFQWLKNGLPFSGGQKVVLQQLEDSSVLLFRRVKANDRGQYTCIATNPATSTNMTSLLVVNVPPSWLSEPSNTSAVLGSSAWMNCSAQGFPAPSVIWRKARESSPGDFGYVTSSPRIRQYNNGSLVLWDVEQGDRGFYLCQASNGIGAPLSKVVFLNVKVPPKFEETYQSKAIKEGDNTSLRCTATGNTPIAITWQRNKTPVPVTVNSKYSLKETEDENRVTSELHISSATRDEGGEYACAAHNDFGFAEATVQLIVQGVPDPPTNLTVLEVSSRTVSLAWEVPFNGNSHITGSSVQYKGAEDGWKGHLSQLIVSGGANRAVLRSLHPLSAYHLRVIAENELGKSRPSEILHVTTLLEAPSAPPRELTVHPTGDQSLKVTWKPPREDARHGPIQGYEVGYRVHPSPSEPFQLKPVEQEQTYVTGLRPFTRYEVVVRARNAAGAGPQSDPVLATTLETAPPTSPILQVVSQTSDSITIRWEKDSKDRSSITEYTLHYKSDDDKWQSKQLRSTDDQYTLEGARCGTRYHLYLTASNSLGTGEPSQSVITRTKGAAPMPAPRTAFVTANTTSALLRLSAWSGAVCAIQRFGLKHRPAHSAHWTIYERPLPADRQTALLSPLAPDRDYVVQVTAHSEAGVTQAEYPFRTLPLPYSPGVSLPPSPLPFHRNVALLIPVVVSSLVLIIVVFAVAICLRKHTSDRRHPHQHQEYDSPKVTADSLLMSEVSSQKMPLGGGGGKQASSHYSSPARGQHKEQHRRTDKQHEYAEPYTAYPSSRQVIVRPCAKCRSLYTMLDDPRILLTPDA